MCFKSKDLALNRINKLSPRSCMQTVLVAVNADFFAIQITYIYNLYSIKFAKDDSTGL